MSPETEKQPPSKPHISRKSFEASFARLVDGSQTMPKKPIERRMLLISTITEMDSTKNYSEAEINKVLENWIERFGADLPIDHVTLRRYLVDEAIVHRDSFGSTYALSDAQPFFTYETSIRSVDLDALLSKARLDRESRKRAFLQKEANESGDA